MKPQKMSVIFRDKKQALQIKYVIENTDLYFFVCSKLSRFDFGRAKSLNMETGILKYSRREEIDRRSGGYSERSCLSDALLSTEILFDKVDWDIYKNTCQDNGSWKKWKMNEFNGKDWRDLYCHMRNVEINRNIFTKLRHLFSKRDELIKP